MFQPTRADKAPTRNQYRMFAIEMPENLQYLLCKRVWKVWLQRLHNAYQPHDLLYKELQELDDFLMNYENDESYILVIDGRLLSLLHRFLLAERRLIDETRMPVPAINDRAEYYDLVIDLLQSVIKPTHLVPLSFCRP